MNRRLHNILSFFSFELTFVLFLFAGLFKADPRLQWVPIDITALFFGLSIICGLVICAKKGFVFNYKALILVLLYLFFASFVVMSYLWTPSKVYSTQKVLYISTLILWSLVAPAIIISHEPSRIKRLAVTFFVLSLIVVLEVLRQYFFVNERGFINIFGSTYLGSGQTIGLAFLLLISYSLFWSRNAFRKLITFILICLYFGALLVGGGRGPFVAALLCVIIPLVFSLRLNLGKKTLTIKRYIKPAGTIIVVSVLLLVLLFEMGELPQTLLRMTVLTHDGMGDSVSVRLELYNHAITFFKHACLFGNGVGAWPVLNGGLDIRGYPHNIFLEILVEFGLFGLTLFLCIVFYSISFLMPLNRLGDKPINIVLLMMFCYLFLNAMVSGDIPDNRVLFACLGLMPAAAIMGVKS